MSSPLRSSLVARYARRTFATEHFMSFSPETLFNISRKALPFFMMLQIVAFGNYFRLFQASIRNCLNCVHNCDDHSLLDWKLLRYNYLNKKRLLIILHKKQSKKNLDRATYCLRTKVFEAIGAILVGPNLL